MSDGVFNLIDRQKLLSGEADYGAGQVSAPPGVEANPVGLVWNAKIGRYQVRFLCVLNPAGPPAFAAVWKPARPKCLKPTLLRKYRRERRDFTAECAKQFRFAFQIVDRMDGVPRITELVYEHGEVEPLDPPIAIPEPVVH